MKKLFQLIAAAIFLANLSARAVEISGAEKFTYKTASGTNLNLFVFQPKEHKAGDRRPAIVFFHGGGWRNGDPSAFLPQCRYFAYRGMVAITVQYRLAPAVKIDGCVRDALGARPREGIGH